MTGLCRQAISRRELGRFVDVLDPPGDESSPFAASAS
jgi:hypothetical protein